MATPDSVSLVSQGVEAAGSAVYDYKRLMHLAFQKPETILQEVRDHWSHFEANANSELKDIVRTASVLLEANEPMLAEQVITTFSHRKMAEAFADCRVLANAAYIRLKASGELNLSNTPVSPDQLW